MSVQSIAKSWSAACLNWEQALLKGESLVPDLPLFQDQADRALKIFSRLRLPDVHGQPTMKEAGGPWFLPIVSALFGSYDAETHTRHLREIFILVPKKNGKSSYSAALMVTALLMNRRPKAEFVLVAPTKDVAGISFRQASGIIESDPVLSKRFAIKDHIKTIIDLKDGATLAIKAADPKVITGIKATGVLIDETHELSNSSKAAGILLELRGALAARPDGFMINITTQSKEPPSGIFKAELEKARAVRDGKLKLPLLPVIYELPDSLKTEWRAKKYWHLVNPNLNRSVSESFLEEQLLAAEQSGPAALSLFASQHFNVEIGLGLKTDSWSGAEYWKSTADPSLTLDSLIARSEVLTIGIDGGGLNDLLGFAVVGREQNTGKWLSWCHAYAHKGVLERFQDIAPRLKDFEQQGDLTIVERMEDAFNDLAIRIVSIEKSGLLAQLGFDPYGVAGIIQALANEGIQGEHKIIGVSQGYKLTGTIKMTEGKLSDSALAHCDQPLMDWCASNAKIELKGNAVMITKAVSGVAKIDPLMALLNAIALMSQNPVVKSKSVYEDEAKQEKPTAQAPSKSVYEKLASRGERDLEAERYWN